MGALGRVAAVAAAVSGAVMAGGCDFLPEESRKHLAGFVNSLLGVKEEQPAPQAAVSAPTGAAPALQSSTAKQTRRNAELLGEMYLVVLMERPSSPSEFGSLVDSLNQGASFEGVYNGLVNSANYRRLENAHPGATEEAVRAFARELAVLEGELPQPTQFDDDSARPLVPANTGEEIEESGDGDEMVFDSGGAKAAGAPPAPAAKPAADAEALSAKYADLFGDASIYTLKRVLASEALKVMEEKGRDAKAFNEWYAQWASRMAGHQVSFGLEQRNSADEKFHLEWAAKVERDLLKWEVLNRLHRLLNSANKKS